MKKKILDKLLIRFIFSKSDKVEEQVELLEKIPEAKIMMQSSYTDNSLRVHNIEILNFFDQESRTD